MSDVSANRGDEPSGAVFWASAAVGAGIIAFGIHTAVESLRPARLLNLAVFVGASGLAHDAVLAPLFVLGALVTRRLPLPVRRTARVALAATAALVLFAAPLWRPRSDNLNPSSLPLAYGRNLVATLVALWCVAAIVAVWHHYRQRAKT